MARNKNLSYQGRYRTENQLLATSTVDCLDIDNQFVFPDMETPQTLIVQWSQTDWTKIISALSLGAFLTYGDDAVEVIETALKVIGCPVEICQAVADCIENDLDTQAAIASAIASSTVIQNAIQTVVQVSNGNGTNPNPNQQLPSSVLDGNIIPGAALCTEGNKYAIARAIVQELDDLSTDFLDVIAVISENSEIAAEMVQAIPIFGGLASLALTGANFINNNIRTQYASAYNSTTELDFSCAIYCAFDDCELSWNMVYDAIAEETLISPPTDTDFATVITWFATNVIGSTDNIVVGAMHLFVLSCLKYGSDWFGSGVYTTLEIAVEDAADEEITVPGSCGCTPSVCWSIYTGYPSGNGGIDNNDGTFSSQDTDAGTYQQRVGIQTQGALIDVEFIGTGTPTNPPILVRVFEPQTPVGGGAIAFSGTWAQFVATGGVVGGSIDISDTLPFTIELEVVGDKC